MNIGKIFFRNFISALFLFSFVFSVSRAQDEIPLTKWDIFSVKVFCKTNELFNVKNPRCDYPNAPKAVADIQTKIDDLPKDNVTRTIVYTGSSGTQYIYVRGPQGEVGPQGPKGDTVYINNNVATTSWGTVWNNTNNTEIRYQYVPVSGGSGTNGVNGVDGEDGNYITLITQDSTSTTYYLFDPNRSSTSTIVIPTPSGGNSNAFVQNGNSFSALATLGTNDNNDLAFETSGTEKMRLTTNGKLGIGTNNPLFDIDVATSATSQGIINVATQYNIKNKFFATQNDQGSIFLGDGVNTDNNIENSFFVGKNSGIGASSASSSNFIGYLSGASSTNADNSNFLGYQSGYQASDASYSNFLGNNSGYQASNAFQSNFLGLNSGYQATGAFRSNFFGVNAGLMATSSSYSNFFGYYSGQSATNASNSNFFGNHSGSGATNAYHSNFFGYESGNNSSNASYSNFFGQYSGSGATNADYSNFLGNNAGFGAVEANNSNFIGTAAGTSAANAAYSNFLGNNAGYEADNAANSIFIGKSAGQNDTVDNTTNGLSSILIGSYTNTGGYSNSILLGSGTSGSPIANTKANQFMLAPSISELNFRGIEYTLPFTQGASGTVLTNNGSGGLNWTSISGIGNSTTTTITSLITGIAPTYQGIILDESFPGTNLNSGIWTGENTPIGVSVNDKLIVSSGLADWSRYMELKKHFLYEKEDIIFDFKPLTKNTGDGWGITQNSLLVLYNSSIYLKVDLSDGVNSGRVSIGNTPAANEYGYSQALDFNAGDNLRLTIRRTPWKTITILENMTSSSTAKAYGEFDLRQWGTQGNYRLTFLGGQQEFTNIKVDSKVRNYGGEKGVVFFGDSITNGIGATSVSKRWTDVLMKGQQNLFENMGVGSWLTGTMTSDRVTELLTGINAKYLFINFGYNDFVQSTPTSTYRTNLETIANTAQGMGYTTIFVSPFPNAIFDSSSYASVMQEAASSTNSKYISIIAATSLASVANPNYLYDGVHPNDEGYRVIAEEVKKQIPEVYKDMVDRIDTGSIKSYDMPFAFGNESIVTVGSDGVFRQALAEQFITKDALRLQATPYETQQGSISFSGDIIQGGSFQQKSDNGLRIGFNNGVNDSNGSNINITNAGTGGAGYPQLFNTISGTENILINALAQVGKMNSAGSISGNRNLLLQVAIPNTLDISGNRNTLISSSNLALTSGSDNILIGEQSGGDISTGSYNIALTNRLNYNGGSSSWAPNNAVGTIMIGTPYDYSGAEPLANGEVVISSYTRWQRIYTFGTKGGLQTSVVWRPGYQGGTDSPGAPLYIQGTRGTGNAESGSVVFQFSSPISSGDTVQSSFTDTLTLNRSFILANKNVGIFNSSPAYALHVGSSTISDGTTLLRLEDINSTCDFNANSGSPSCGSDITLKKDISSLDTGDLLIRVATLTPVSYHWKTQQDGDTLNYGFIAQDVGAQFPDLVHEGTWVDGSTRLFLNTGGLMPYVVGAIKELKSKLDDVFGINNENSTFAEVMRLWLSNAGNKIKKIFTGEICLTDENGSTCINRQELDQLKNIINQNNSSNNSAGSENTIDNSSSNTVTDNSNENIIDNSQNVDNTNASSTETQANQDGTSDTQDSGQNTTPDMQNTTE